ncbi:unnamed protein product [Prunus armeniaca]
MGESTTQVSGRKTPESLAVSSLTMPNGKGGSELPDDPRDEGAMPQALPVEELETISTFDTQRD